jgi:hypothetical protein
MNRPPLQRILLSVFLIGFSIHAAAAPFLFSYFTGNGEDGLHLAWSADGLTWEALNAGASFLEPRIGSKLMRDPSICQGPDGTFHMVWTTGWHDKGIGVAHSRDLLEWSDQEWLKVMDHEPEARNCWAPEIFYDAATETYLVFWSTTIPGRFPETEEEEGDNLSNHRVYMTSTKNFETWTDPVLFYEDGFNVIDATILREEDQYVMLIKDETLKPVARKNIRIAMADKAIGPYSRALKAFSPTWVEGPTALKIDDYWYVYYDAYTRGRMEGTRTKDFKAWEDITNQLRFPKGVRHGTAFPVDQAVLDRLRELSPGAEE